MLHLEAQLMLAKTRYKTGRRVALKTDDGVRIGTGRVISVRVVDDEVKVRVSTGKKWRPNNWSLNRVELLDAAP